MGVHSNLPVRIFISVIAAVFLLYCRKKGITDTGIPEPTVPTTWTKEQIKAQIVTSNLANAMLGNTGRLVRWTIPIEVNTNRIVRADEAILRYETLTGKLIRFVKVTHVPTNGVVYVEGGAVKPDGLPGTGNVNNTPLPDPHVAYTVDTNGILKGLYYIHLGSTASDDSAKGNYPSAVAEHELGHVLGIMGHFDGFTGNEGFKNPNMFNVMVNLYNNPIGTVPENLTITVVAVGQFGNY